MSGNQQPFFSIITPNFNKGRYVLESIDSVINQNFNSWEYLFVDDQSTDDSGHLAAKALSGHDRCQFFENNSGIRGANAARNLALNRAKGRYVIFLDSDDLLAADALSRRKILADQYPDLAYFVLPMRLFFDQIGDSDLIVNIPSGNSDLHRFLKRDLVWLITGPTWKCETLRALGGFDMSLHSQQDYDLHVRALISRYSYRYFHLIPDSFYRRNVESEPRKHSQSVEHFRHRADMVIRHADLLLDAGMLEDSTKSLLAAYLLDLAQMMRWHKVELGSKEALSIALSFWENAEKYDLVDRSKYLLGSVYIRFKHELRFNRVAALQCRIDTLLKRKLGVLIFTPSEYYCKLNWDSYAS